jgi:plastocyanin
MINILRRGMVFFLFLSAFLVGCTRPEDNAIKPLKPNIFPQVDSAGLQQKAYIPKIYTVEISGMKFNPAEVIINKGDIVRWKNNDMVVHCVTELPSNAWTSSKIPSGGFWQIAINSSCAYFCAIHLVMKGKIVVK